MEREWQVAARAPQEHFKRFEAWSPLVAQVLYNRGFRDPEEARRFLNGEIGNANPFNLLGMRPAVERIRQAIAGSERIVVHGDFDADGVTSTALLVEALHALGARVAPYIPDRVDEGYGLNNEALNRMAEAGVGLVVTVDCGIRAQDEIAHARRLGLDVIVTDHHALGDTLPDADAIVNPKQEGERYPFLDFSGVGLAFKLAQALYLAQQRSPVGSPRGALVLDELLDLVALGTVADMVPLKGENRALVQAGLAQLNLAERPGVRALLAVANVAPGTIDAQKVAFRLGPRLNAAGRLDKAMLAYKLLFTRDTHEALQLAQRLEALNAQRKRLTDQAVSAARARLAQPDEPLLMVDDENFAEGIVGLVAGKLAEALNRPVVVVRRGPPDGESRGSARSIPGFHITEALDQCKDLLLRHGGHAAAAGFTLRTANLPLLAERLRALVSEQLPGPPPPPVLEADAEARLELVTADVVDQLATLAPFGQGNREPHFVLRGLQVHNARRSRDGDHLRLEILDAHRRVWKAIAFGQARHLDGGLPLKKIDVVGHFEREYWRGQVELQLCIQDLRPTAE